MVNKALKVLSGTVTDGINEMAVVGFSFFTSTVASTHGLIMNVSVPVSLFALSKGIDDSILITLRHVD